MATAGLAFSPLLNVNGGKFDLLQVWDGSKYVSVADMLKEQEDQVESDEGRLQVLEGKVAALEDKVTSLDETKATKFVAISPLHLKTDVFPNEL